VRELCLGTALHSPNSRLAYQQTDLCVDKAVPSRLHRPGHPPFCCFHARKYDQTNAAETLGRQIDYFFQ